jgi:regulator of protease activity HflC (stomatin/prohibitin superfamily)
MSKMNEYREYEFIYKYWKWITVSICGLFLWFYSLGNCNDQSWLIIQYPWGNVKVIDTPGWFFKAGATCWYYPRNWQVEYEKEHSFKVVFNDGGSAIMNAMVRFASPLTLDGKRKFHQLFGGNEDSVEAAVWAHLSDSMKSSGPVMSASEHQSARRGEFTSLVQDQLQKGLFEMKRVSKTLHDQFDDKGKSITVYATEVVTEENNVAPKISRSSPLTDFGIVITQFSITDVVYDEQTQRQFSQKKESFLAAEGSKAQREKEVQERLMVEERGRREKAETESLALRQKAQAVIEAQKEKEVQELNAARRLAVAQLQKQESETVALQQLEVARLALQTAREEAEAQIVLAGAREKALRMGGAISEKDKMLAEIERDKAIGVALHLSKISVPGIVIMGGSAQGGDTTGSLMNMFLLKKLGILPDDKS